MYCVVVSPTNRLNKVKNKLHNGPRLHSKNTWKMLALFRIKIYLHRYIFEVTAWAYNRDDSSKISIDMIYISNKI
jgi:hypothetical protein